MRVSPQAQAPSVGRSPWTDWQATVPERPSDRPSPGSPRILVVEDEKLTRRSLRAILQQSGFEILEAETGEEGLEQFQRTRPDAAVLDIMLPRMDGFEVCRQIRAIDAKIGILFLTAKNLDVDKIRGLETGADDYIVKPFNPDELVARLRAVLRRSTEHPSPEDPLGSGLFRMHPRTQQCFKGDAKIDLTPKEAALLKVFLKNPGKTLPRQELRQEVWGKEHFGSDKALDVYVRKLREKIEQDPSHPTHLKTAWGVGYVWKSELDPA